MFPAQNPRGLRITGMRLGWQPRIVLFLLATWAMTQLRPGRNTSARVPEWGLSHAKHRIKIRSAGPNNPMVATQPRTHVALECPFEKGRPIPTRHFRE